MSLRLQSLALLVLGVLAQNAAAYFRMSCSRMRIGRIDPVVNFGKVSPHVHKISGASSKYFHRRQSTALSIKS